MANSKNIGRNDPCQCGSGRKVKRCCGTGNSYRAPGGWIPAEWEDAQDEVIESLDTLQAMGLIGYEKTGLAADGTEGMRITLLEPPPVTSEELARAERQLAEWGLTA